MRVLQLSSCTVDLAARQVQRGGEISPLSPKEVELLQLLAEQPNQIVPTNEIIDAVWGSTSEKTLSVTLRRLRTKLEDDPSDPKCIETHRGIGLRLVLPNSPTVPGTSSTGPLVGRDADVAQLKHLLSQGDRLITLLGPGGVGKTRLAMEIAEAWSLSAPARFFDIARAHSAEEIAACVGTSLGLALRGDLIAQVGQVGASQSAGARLWVLDNAEQALEGCKRCLQVWLSCATAVRFLVTSRVPIGLAGERAIWVQPLGFEAAMQLIERVAPSLSGGPADERRALADLVALTDGLPLALELAAPAASALGAVLVRDRWATLAPTLRGSPGRHASLDDAFHWSWEALTDNERAAVVRLATFQSPFGLAQAEAVLDGQALPLLGHLVRCSLVTAADRGSNRFRMLSLVRTAVADRASSVQWEEAQARHLKAILAESRALSQVADSGDVSALVDLERLVPEVVSALDHAAASRDADAACSLVQSLLPLAEQRGLTEPYGRMLRAALSIEGGAPVARGEALVSLASVRLSTAQDALRHAQDALEIAREFGDRDLEARALTRLGDAMLHCGAPGARALYKQAVAIHDEEPGLRGWFAPRYRYAAFLAQGRGDEGEITKQLQRVPENATPWQRAAMQDLNLFRVSHVSHADAVEAWALGLAASYERSADQDGLGRVLNNLGAVLATRGQLSRARQALQRALGYRRHLGLLGQQAVVYVSLARVYAQQGDLAAFTASVSEAGRLIERSGEDRTLSLCRLVYAEGLVRFDRGAEARIVMSELGAKPNIQCSPEWMGALLCLEATLLAADRDPQARGVASRAIAQLEGQDPLIMITARAVLSRILWDHGEMSEAEALAQATLTWARKLGHKSAVGRCLVLLAELCARRGQLQEALSLRDEARQDAEDPTVIALASSDLERGDIVSQGGRSCSLELRWARGGARR